ncbi:MAG TPA: hypothetical protein VN026_05500 [Bacteroidia bacterium]|jgi:hypothetical protein|nr:hypothetical protein [Bacteroidia bacterium]
MKRLILFSVLVLSTLFAFAQTDTLFSGKKKIACKIMEISESEFKYKLAELPDGPTYVIDRSTVSKYVLSTGFSEIIKADEMSLEHEHKEILGNREVIKIQPFSFAFNCISIGYEKVIKVGTNLDIEAGYINNSMTTNQSFYSYGTGSSGSAPFCYGFYFKPGVKFFLGQDFSVKGLKYAHPLKGRYIKLDLAISYLNLQNITRNNGYYGGYQITSTDITSMAFGGFVNYGRQFILGNVLTLDYYFGLGWTAQANSYSNPGFVNVSYPNYLGGTNNYIDDQAKNIYRYGGFARIPGVGISGTAGLRIGYIIPSKKAVKRVVPVTTTQGK